jgi:hypothetical protein
MQKISFFTLKINQIMAIPQKYRSTVNAAAKAAGGLGVPGAFSFGLDVAGMITIWSLMIREIAIVSGHRVDAHFAKKIAYGVGAGVAAYVGGSKIAMKLLHLIPGMGTLAAIGVNTGLNFLFTYKLGSALAKMFDKGAFDDGDVTEAVYVLTTLVAALPALSDVSDMMALANEDVTPEMFERFKNLVKNA